MLKHIKCVSQFFSISPYSVTKEENKEDSQEASKLAIFPKKMFSDIGSPLNLDNPINKKRTSTAIKQVNIVSNHSSIINNPSRISNNLNKLITKRIATINKRFNKDRISSKKLREASKEVNLDTNITSNNKIINKSIISEKFDSFSHESLHKINVLM